MATGELIPIEYHGPSISVRFFGSDYLLVGHGSLLKVYNYKTAEVLTSKKIFKKNKIHGITFHRDTLAFYGARSLSILSFSQILEDENLFENEKMINDWIIAGEFSYNGLELFILTAHNVILSIDSYSVTYQWEKSVEGEHSILYSGSIKVTSNRDVYVSAGTVMGGVIIWDLFKEERLHNLLGHEGSIFNVKISDQDRYIVSCSDDRSIKLWDFKSGELLSTAWGHTARIWNLKFYNNDGAVVSVSEDLTSRTWTITEEQQLVSNQTYELHNGRHIWGLDVTKDNKYAATAGNDGRVRLVDIETNKVEKESKHYPLSEIAGANYEVQKGEIIKGFWKLSFGLVLITSKGGVFTLKNGLWKHQRSDEKFVSFSLTNGYSKENIVTFTNSKGYTLLLKFNDDGDIIKEQTIHSDVSKVINALSTTDGKNLFLLVESPNNNDKLIVYQFNGKLEIVSTTFLEKKPTFVTTCFEITGDLVFVGFRLSSLGIYQLSTSKELNLIKKLSISDTVTSIKKLQENDNHLLLTITNRDGYYLYFKFNKNDLSHEYVHTNDVRKGFLEGALEIDNELIIYGFKSSYFYIYNESRDYEIVYENCGGAHRLWKLFHEENSFDFVYVRGGELTIRTIIKPEVPYLLNDGTHGREIRDISIREKSYKHSKGLFVTGAEDTTLKISALDFDSGDVRNYWTIRKHTAGLQKVKFLNNNLVASSSAREEFFIWKVDEDFDYPLVSLIGSLKPSSDNPDLRIMDFGHTIVYEKDVIKGVVIVNVYSDSSIKVFYFDLAKYEFTTLISGRYKTCCLFGVQLFIHEGRVQILTGATDGHLSVWDITEEIPFIILNGNLQISNVGGEKHLPPLSVSIAVHQNGIKGFEVFPYPDRYLVITGGDDNGLGLTEFRYSQNGITAQLLSFEPDAASSTITSVSRLTDERILVASVDQIVRLWGFKNEQLKLLDEHYTSVADTGSSDVVNNVKGDYGLVGGVGLSVWKIK